MTAIYEYYDDEWRTKVFQCSRCDWSGTCEDMAGPNIYEELVDYRCGKCFNMLLIVSHPFWSQTLEAAAAGNEYALYEIGVRSGEGKYYEQFMWDLEEANKKIFGPEGVKGGPVMIY